MKWWVEQWGGCLENYCGKSLSDKTVCHLLGASVQVPSGTSKHVTFYICNNTLSQPWGRFAVTFMQSFLMSPSHRPATVQHLLTLRKVLIFVVNFYPIKKNADFLATFLRKVLKIKISTVQKNPFLECLSSLAGGYNCIIV